MGATLFIILVVKERFILDEINPDKLSPYIKLLAYYVIRYQFVRNARIRFLVKCAIRNF